MGRAAKSPASSRRASERAIETAAWSLFAAHEPASVTVRDLAGRSGRAHGLVVRYFPGDALADVVGEQLVDQVTTALVRCWSAAGDPVLEVLRLARAEPDTRRLLVRAGLGDLRPRGFPECLQVERIVAVATERGLAGAVDRTPVEFDRRARLCSYSVGALVLGWLTLEPFLVDAADIRGLSDRQRDGAVARAVGLLLDATAHDHPRLVARDLVPAEPGAGPSDAIGTGGGTGSSRDALLWTAVRMFGERSPAAVTVRDLAREAGVNPGLVHRHFGSKAGLLSAAIEEGTVPLFVPARAAGGFDIDRTVGLLHRGAGAIRLVARALVDGLDIRTLRPEHPVFDALLTSYGPAEDHDPSPTDRLPVAMAAALAMGSTIWGEHLRGPLRLNDDDGVESAVADLGRVLLASVPGRAGG